MKNIEFAEKAKKIANEYKTLYIQGCFGAPMNAKNKKRYSTNREFNKKRADLINSASSDTFGFDCVGLIHGLLWQWCGDINAVYGGAIYPTKKMEDEGYPPDFSTEKMLDYCDDVSTDFSNIVIGEVLYLKGHAGIYIGDGLAVECTPSWQNKVQITAIGNIGKKVGYNVRNWTKHGKIKWVEYSKEPKPTPTPVPKPSKEYFEPNKNYKLLYNKYLRTSPKLDNNIARYNCLDNYSKTICNNVNGNAQLKVGTEITPLKIYKEDNGRIWASYGNCWWCCQNVDGTKQAVKLD